MFILAFSKLLFKSGLKSANIGINEMRRKKVTKAVIAAAGYGTRFLPATKNIPKELIPVINMPTIQFAVDECVASGITDIIIVTRYGNSSLEDYFDSSPELERSLRESGKDELAERIRQIYTAANIVFVRQTTSLPYGNGSPLLAAKHLIDNDEAFIYLYGDDVIFGPPACKELIDKYKEDGASAVLGVAEVDLKTVTPGALIKLRAGTKDRVEKIVEKPPIDKAPSNLFSFGRYLFKYRIFDYLDPKKTGKGNELWTADAIDRLAKEWKVVVQPISGKWFTTGDPLHYLEVIFEYSYRNPELKAKLLELISHYSNIG